MYSRVFWGKSPFINVCSSIICQPIHGFIAYPHVTLPLSMQRLKTLCTPSEDLAAKPDEKKATSKDVFQTFTDLQTLREKEKPSEVTGVSGLV